MDKNTIWAIVLSTLVIIGSYLILPRFFPGLNPMWGPQASAQVETEDAEEPEELDLSASETSEESSLLAMSADIEESEDSQSSISEEKYTIRTDKVEAVFTNKGGDIISYKLLDHKDMDTDDFVQLSDNVNSKNRTCAIAFGGADAKIIDEIFNTEVNDKSITFTKTMNVNGKKTTLRKVYTFMDGEYVFKLDVLIHTADSTGLNAELLIHSELLHRLDLTMIQSRTAMNAASLLPSMEINIKRLCLAMVSLRNMIKTLSGVVLQESTLLNL